jgi:phosphatidate cytidylyltransferase
MKKLIQRLLMFIVAVPLVVALVLFLPQRHHLAVNTAIIILCALGALEFAAMLNKRGMTISRFEAILLGILGPAALTITVSFEVNLQILPIALAFGGFWLLVSRVFPKTGQFEDSLTHIAAGFSVMMYPGMFMTWIIKMAALPHADRIIFVFLLGVIANDSTAWAVGMLFGKGNQGIIPASPNKSVAGFIGGFAASILVGIGAVYLAPEVFSPRLLSPLPSGLILGILAGAAASLGDLAESVMKRSSDIKDSGSIIPGRGGVLDSIDSIALAAPVFYGLYGLLFG